MNLNFSTLGTTSFTSNAKNYLKPYNIYEVSLTKFEPTTLKGSKDPNSSYPVINIEFTGEDGVFNNNIFIPATEQDFVRNENPNSHKIMPSRFDHYQFTLMQIVEAINPTGAQKIKDNASKLKTIEQFTDLVCKALKGKENVKVFLKLVGQNTNGTVYARLPNACLIGNYGNPAALNFINPDESKLFFSSYELTQMKAMKDAAPTNMDNLENPDTKEDNLDLDNIDL